MSLDPVVHDALQQLLSALDLGSSTDITALHGGRNNRAYRVDTASRPVLLKQYYGDADDPRDRLAADFEFSRFAWRHGVGNIAEPLGAHPLFRIALYELVEGCRLRPDEVTPARVQEALGFVVALNAHRDTADARVLPFASEACFSLEDHVATVAARIRRLQSAGIDSNSRARDVLGRLTTIWERVRSAIEARGMAWDVPGKERCLSPSDFGFHNAIARPNGRLVFHDFEYAGWDDPAKLVCDFFSQVELPVPEGLLDTFLDSFSDGLALPGRHRQHVQVLLPVLRVKWCCIVLNDLLPDGHRRRRFAAAPDGIADGSDAQLRRAGELIDKIERDCDAVR